MSATKHTPGPWVYEAGDSESCGAIVAQNRFVCEFIEDPTAYDGRLIATAPKLLAALQVLLPHMNTILHFADGRVADLSETDAVEIARAAILEATGESA